jgi:hypothetical protein
MNLKGYGRHNFFVLFQHIRGGTEKNYKKPQSGEEVSRPKLN